MEWGCMQALIDFDGWRQWKDFTLEEQAEKKASASKAKAKKNRLSMTTAAA
jgi:osomolarity two-component system, response regulator SSK1